MRAVDMPARTGLTVQRLSPFGVFECKDGYVALVAVHHKLALGLFEAMGQPELIDDPRFATRDARVANADALEAAINAWSRTLPVAEAVAALEARGVPVAPVRHPEEALADPRVVARDETNLVAHPDYASIEELRTAGIPIRFSGARSGFDPVLPVRIGEHNEDVLGGLLGYDAARLASLEADGVIA
jgi:crotonobetainyl-CoA:carnitine CoA-transferase CaiB-like acyl-CoA transferase